MIFAEIMPRVEMINKGTSPFTRLIMEPEMRGQTLPATVTTHSNPLDLRNPFEAGTLALVQQFIPARNNHFLSIDDAA